MDSSALSTSSSDTMHSPTGGTASIISNTSVDRQLASPKLTGKATTPSTIDSTTLDVFTWKQTTGWLASAGDHLNRHVARISALFSPRLVCHTT
ncbi:unnamed protein product [Protopolystoma xenopodis]|uniref:Uncharacterized protein n=1 Tax=Protopolystoma xenopodis TaxID=117903 RepID=A0A3S5AH05_9PLAT|nr:unnamed protein product [Protopolystoma xenopodis]